MPLLKNGSPYQLEEGDLVKYGQKMIWHVPPRPFDVENNRHGIGFGMSIPNKYVMKMGNAMVEMCYYTNSVYDDGVKKNYYLVENTGESIKFDEKGVITTQNAELNFFLDNNPHNHSNSYRMNKDGLPEDPSKNPYLDKPVLFHRYRPQDSHRVAAAKTRAIARLQQYIDVESMYRWDKEDILNACQIILSNATVPIPSALLSYREFQEEPDLTTIRNAIMELVLREPLQMETLILDRRELHVLKMVNECLQFSEVSGLSYNATERKYVLKKGNDVQEFLKIPERKNPEQHILAMAKQDSKLFRRLWNIWDAMNKQIAETK